MSRSVVMLLGSALLVGSAPGAAAGDKAPAGPKDGKGAAEPYEGFRADQAALRKQVVLKTRDSRETKASSAEACAAARRIFGQVSFLFRSRAEVLDLLGDPATISDYGRPAGKDPADPLVYRFDTGLGGWQFTIGFDRRGRAIEVRVEVLD